MADVQNPAPCNHRKHDPSTTLTYCLQYGIHQLPYISFVTHAMMVCGTCKGLQKQFNAANGAQQTEATAHLVDASLPDLRASASNCRACALLLQGILLHHDRFRDVKEDGIQITANSFTSTSGNNSQGHLSVEARWKEQYEDDDQEDDEHEHTGWPNLKLEFFTDRGRFAPPTNGRHHLSP